nr:hypothetical protein StreXyl84_28970 [Streptomyces sp. Xyl84]
MWWSCLGLHRTEVFVSHRNARLTVHGRRLLIERVRSGRSAARSGGNPDRGARAAALPGAAALTYR